MICLAKARNLLEAECSSIGVEVVALSESAQRYLATDVSVSKDFPLFDNSAMDGFAVRRSDLERKGSLPVTIRVSGVQRAGQ